MGTISFLSSTIKPLFVNQIFIFFFNRIFPVKRENMKSMKLVSLSNIISLQMSLSGINRWCISLCCAHAHDVSALPRITICCQTSLSSAFSVAVSISLIVLMYSSFITFPTQVEIGLPGGLFTGLRNSFNAC